MYWGSHSGMSQYKSYPTRRYFLTLTDTNKGTIEKTCIGNRRSTGSNNSLRTSVSHENCNFICKLNLLLWRGDWPFVYLFVYCYRFVRINLCWFGDKIYLGGVQNNYKFASHNLPTYTAKSLASQLLNTVFSFSNLIKTNRNTT